VTNAQPYDQVGETFTLEVRIDASDLPPGGEGSTINGYSICLSYEPAKIEPLSNTPFTNGNYLSGFVLGHVSNFLENNLTLEKDGRMEEWKHTHPSFHSQRM
jgi:hypothetical protein